MDVNLKVLGRAVAEMRAAQREYGEYKRLNFGKFHDSHGQILKREKIKREKVVDKMLQELNRFLIRTEPCKQLHLF